MRCAAAVAAPVRQLSGETAAAGSAGDAGADVDCATSADADQLHLAPAARSCLLKDHDI